MPDFTKRAMSFSVFGALLLTFAALAHQPRFVTQDKVVEIDNPEVSQAYYGILNGSPATYRIVRNEPFDLYVSLLVPDVKGVAKDVSAKIKHARADGGTSVFVMDGCTSAWAPFHEPFANDDYFQGPEFKKNAAPPGTYELNIRRPGNVGRYVFVIGQAESFPPGEALKAVWLIPQLKMRFFDKPFYLIFWSKIGLFLLAAAACSTAVMAGLASAGRKLFRKKL